MRVPITNQFQVVMYLQAAINISFQVVFTFVFVLCEINWRTFEVGVF